MAESFVNVTEGSGKKLHTNTRSIGGNTVHDEAVVLGEQYLASYVLQSGLVAITTTDSHLVALMSGSSNKLYIRRITVSQGVGLASAADSIRFDVIRLTTAGTGGTDLTSSILPFDTSDATAGATARTLPSSKGTEATNPLLRGIFGIKTTDPVIAEEWQWEAHNRAKPIIVPAGTTNGLAVKLLTTDTTANCLVRIEFDEVAF